MSKANKGAKPGAAPSTIALNKRARHDYSLEDRLEAGLVLEGWEVKSLRAGKAQLVDSYVLFKDGEVLAKELKRKNAKAVDLASLNPTHKDRSIPASDILWIARIVWASQ